MFWNNRKEEIRILRKRDEENELKIRELSDRLDLMDRLFKYANPDGSPSCHLERFENANMFTAASFGEVQRQLFYYNLYIYVNKNEYRVSLPLPNYGYYNPHVERFYIRGDSAYLTVNFDNEYICKKKCTFRFVIDYKNNICVLTERDPKDFNETADREEEKEETEEKSAASESLDLDYSGFEDKFFMQMGNDLQGWRKYYFRFEDNKGCVAIKRPTTHGYWRCYHCHYAGGHKDHPYEDDIILDDFGALYDESKFRELYLS